MRTSIISSVAVLSLCFGVTRGECQTPPTSSSPVFGGAQERNIPNDGLDLTVQVFEAYDDDVLATDGSLVNLNRPTVTSGSSGFYSGINMLLLHAIPGERAAFKSWVHSSLGYYPDLKDLTAIYHRLGLEFSAPLGGSVTVHGRPFAEYSPRYAFRLFPIQETFAPDPGASVSEAIAAPAPEIDYTFIKRDTYRYGGSVGANFSLTDRASVGLDYGHVQATFQGGFADMQVESAGAGFGYKFNRTASFKAEYSRHEARYEGGRPSLNQNIIIGIDYLKPLSITRRTFLQFSTGSAIIEDTSGTQSMRATGTASLRHQIARSWSARADYRRGVGYIEGFNQPVFSDSAGAGLGGLMSRRVEFSADARYFRGAVGLTANSRPFESYSAWVRLRTALTRRLAAYAEYLFYHYEFADSAARPVGMPPSFDRNGVRVGLSLWVPLVEN